MKRIHTFDDVVGHKWIIDYLRGQLAKEKLPHFIIMEGPEGVGKTTLADLVAIELAYGKEMTAERDSACRTIIDKKMSTDLVKKFECSVDGGKGVALEILDEMSPPINSDKVKVIICDECHRFTPAAQDVILPKTEYLDDRVYVLMMTTDITMLQAALRSRAFIIKVPTLSQGDMLRVLKDYVHANNIQLQAEDITLQMIAEWAEFKPRTGLKILEGFGANAVVSTEMIRGLIGFLDVSQVMPVLVTLSGSLSAGLAYINEMPLHSSIVTIVSELIAVKSGAVSYKLRMDEIHSIRTQLANVTVEQLVMFLEGITRHKELTRQSLINAFIRAHASRELLYNSSRQDVLEMELKQKSEVKQDVAFNKSVEAPTLKNLLLSGTIVQ